MTEKIVKDYASSLMAYDYTKVASDLEVMKRARFMIILAKTNSIAEPCNKYIKQIKEGLIKFFEGLL